jgi:hypothetical protein
VEQTGTLVSLGRPARVHATAEKREEGLCLDTSTQHTKLWDYTHPRQV